MIIERIISNSIKIDRILLERDERSDNLHIVYYTHLHLK